MEMEELSMDGEKMKQDLGGDAVFDIMKKHSICPVFYGRMLSENAHNRGVPIGNVSFAPSTINNWQFIIKAVKSCL